jgi:hypothetical protein
MVNKQRILTAAEINAQIPAARARDAAERRAGLRASKAWYDPSENRVMLLLTNGVLAGIPVGKIKYLARVKPAELQAVTLTPGGYGVCWDSLDVDLSVPDLILDAFGRAPLMGALGSLGGRATSESKAAAARRNGARGGRPRKHAAR